MSCNSEALNFDVVEEAAADPVKACFKFHTQNVGEPKHYYETIDSALAGREAFCLLHKKQCESPKTGASLFVAGFPCSPFSSQRGDRGKLRCAERNILAKAHLLCHLVADSTRPRKHDCRVIARVVRWQDHKDAVIMTRVLDWIQHKMPESGLLENVEGLSFAAGGERSALDLVLERLVRLGYATDWRVVDLSHHMACCRKRHTWHNSRSSSHLHLFPVGGSFCIVQNVSVLKRGTVVTWAGQQALCWSL
eukprot:6471193-Amphidinium_carterae.1